MDYEYHVVRCPGPDKCQDVAALESQLQAAETELDSLKKCYDITNQSWKDMQAEDKALRADIEECRKTNYDFGIMNITLGMLLIDYGDKNVYTVPERLVGAVKSVLSELEALRARLKAYGIFEPCDYKRLDYRNQELEESLSSYKGLVPELLRLRAVQDAAEEYLEADGSITAQRLYDALSAAKGE